MLISEAVRFLEGSIKSHGDRDLPFGGILFSGYSIEMLREVEFQVFHQGENAYAQMLEGEEFLDKLIS